MGVNIFSSSLSAMNAAQTGMATTQHNIANAGTPGFSRQEVVIAPRGGQQIGAGFVGSGVDVKGVVRVYDQYLTNQVRLEQTQSSYLTAYHAAMTQIDNLVADPAAGASPAIQEFFSALNGVANNPESVPARQTLIGTSQFVVNRFQAIEQRMTDIANGLNGQITNSVTSINNLAQQISTLNASIKRGVANGQGQQPNDLIDQRDQVINQLNQQIKVTVQPQQDGAVNVFVGNGQTLVVNETAMRLDVTRSITDPSRVDIVYRDGNIVTPMQQTGLQGGSLGAYLSFRDQSLEPARNALGRAAIGLADSMNRQNRIGLDLTGAPGRDMFNVAVPRVERGVSNIGTGVATAAISDVSQLTTSDYLLKYDGANYSMVRLSDSAMTNVGTTATPPTNYALDGFSFTVSPGAQRGDTFMIRPTADGARDIKVALTNPAGIAAAAPIRAMANMINIGNATINNVTVDATYNAAAFTPPPTLTYDAATNTLSGFPPALPVTVTTVSGVATTFAAGAPVTYTDGATYSAGGVSFAMTGTPSSGSFVGGSNVATVSATNFSVVGVPLTSGSVSFTATDFNFAAAAFGTSTPQAVSDVAHDFSIPAAAQIDGFNNQAVVAYDFSGANLAQMDVDGIGVTLITNVVDDAGLKTAIESQLPGYTVTINAPGDINISKNGSLAAVAITNADANAVTAGFASSAGSIGTAAQVTTNASLTVDGTAIVLNGNNTNRLDVANELTAKMQASGLLDAANYSAAVDGNGAIVITHSGSLTPVAIGGADANAVAAGFVNSLGAAGALDSNPSTLGIDGNTVTLNQNYGSYTNMAAAISAQLGGNFTVTADANGDLITGDFKISRTLTGAASTAIGITGDAAADAAGITTLGATTGIAGTDYLAQTVANFTVGTSNVTLNQTYPNRTAVRDALQAQLPGYVVADNGSRYTFTSLASSTPVAISNADAGAIAAGFVNSAGTSGALATNANLGDKFSFALNTNATGDNRNALLMSGMQNQNIMANGTATFQGIYGQLVGEVGAKTHELFVTSEAQTNMTAQIVAAQQAVSGVNLDEEAANLMRFQRAYQAAAKAMQVSNAMFDSLMSIM